MKNFLIFSVFFWFAIALSACGNSATTEFTGPTEKELENLNESNFPIVKEQITLDFFAGQAPATNPDWNDVLIFNEYEEMTNIDINWKMVPHETLSEQRNLAFGSGNLPDAFHSTGIGTADLMKYGEQGMLIPLNDLIDEYAPNFKKIMKDNPDIEKSVTMPDGNIYSLPLIGEPDFLSYRMGPKPFINKVWLDELSMDMPETTEEYYQYLKAVKEQSPSNGAVEEVPFGGPFVGTLYQYLLGSFGLQNKGSAGGLIDVDPDSGDYRFYPISEQYKELLVYMNKLFSEGLIEKNIFTIDHHQYVANYTEGKYGSVVWYSPTKVTGEEVGSQYVGMPALEGPFGDKQWTTLSDPVLIPGAFAITSENKHPAATMRWIDYFYGEEGLEFFFMGIEGETYEEDEEGNLVYKDHILNSEDDLSLTEELKKYFSFPGGGFPSMTTQRFFQGAESSPESIAAAETLEPYLIDDRWIRMPHTKEESDQLRGFGTDIEKYVSEMREKFISGAEPMSNWDTYVNEIENMGLEDYMEVKTTAIERQFAE
ncbi:extracellular solute-binding protein [Bacillaceae bacterium SIJ1]|uniref:extracellular solute-binding protein n=1 Tax=Litoribacterium kuwaitense TaxID=1398745 RepID=UPI0013EA79AC|nr:extracellular solute-binding protein [Litoribacterium kuwaitense]NGP43836.1 extracellular solute-binding protein [Litoribacterium kuwaitense]